MANVLEQELKQEYELEQEQRPRHHTEFEVDRGPDWLFVRLSDPGVNPDGDRTTRSQAGELQGKTGYPIESLADQLWTLLNQHFVYRLVLEMDEVQMFSSSLMGQLVMVQKRVLQHGGAFRLCGLTPQCQQALHLCRLDQIMPNFPNRESAVHAYTRSKPR